MVFVNYILSVIDSSNTVLICGFCCQKTTKIEHDHQYGVVRILNNQFCHFPQQLLSSQSMIICNLGIPFI